MNQYDLISFDMDGTLLNSRQNISENTKKAINKAVSENKTVILSTGRSVSELQDYKKDLENVRYYICSSGAIIFDSFEEQIIYSNTIPSEIVTKIIEASKQYDTMIYIASNGYQMCNYSDVLRMEHFLLGKYKDLMLKTAVLLEDIITSFQNEMFPVEKLNLFCASAEIRESLHNILSPLPITMAYAEAASLEISPLHVSKAFGLQKLCDYLSISIEKTIAVGDSDNDIEIIKAAGLSIAMDNAFPHIKALCDVIVADNDHDGCAEAIEKYLLGK
ncbi:MAG: Cof-type HAD-IIB family hydrolase [Eubacteriales bacterium]|nr:Cof-type HAD-IIB family hydrolase [Eubacteriales bacterium]